MAGKILKILSNDLHGNVDDRNVRVYACFEHSKYMNNYVVFSIEGENNKLYCGSIHLKDKSLVVFSIKDDIKKYILEFINEYMSDKLNNYKLLDISHISKIELVSYSSIEYNNIQLLDDKSIPKIIPHEEEEKENKPLFLYILLFVLLSFGIGISILYFKPELFTVKYKLLDCRNNLYDNNMELNYNIDKIIKFNKNDEVNSISVTRTYIFLDSDRYYNFRDNNEQDNYFNNGEGYKYIDNNLEFRVFYQENSVIDNYNEMLTYMKREGYNCIESEYEE